MCMRKERSGERMALYGKVLMIFDETSLLINLGSTHGLKRGDRFVVIQKGDEVKDPETGKSLGTLEYVKAELIAVDVQENIGVLVTDCEESPSADLPLSSRMVRDSVRDERDKGRRMRLSVAAGEMAGQQTLSPVRRGDLIRKVE
jgi:hypothetical protein